MACNHTLVAVDPEDYTQHGGGHVDGEDVVSIGKETNTGNDAGTNMTPAKLSVVNLLEGLATALVGIDDGGGVGGVRLNDGVMQFALLSHCERISAVRVKERGQRRGRLQERKEKKSTTGEGEVVV